jgi:hypothetical protein
MFFPSRAEAGILHQPSLKISFQPLKIAHWEEPDSILRCLLDSPDKRYVAYPDAPLRECIESSPFRAESEPLLFLFGQFEAKSNKRAPRVANAIGPFQATLLGT